MNQGRRWIEAAGGVVEDEEVDRLGREVQVAAGEPGAGGLRSGTAGS